MTEKSFSAVDCISEAWSLVKGAKWPIWSVFLASILCNVLSLIPFIGIIFICVSIYLTIGMIYLGLLRGQGKDIHFSMIKDIFNIKTILYVIGGFLLLYLFILLMFFLPTAIIAHFQLPHEIKDLSVLQTPINAVIAILFLFWVVYAAYLYLRISYLVLPIVLLQQKNPWAAMVESYKATQSHVLSLSLLFILQFIFYFVGMIPLGIGLIWTLPLFFISTGVAYKKLVLKA